MTMSQCRGHSSTCRMWRPAASTFSATRVARSGTSANLASRHVFASVDANGRRRGIEVGLKHVRHSTRSHRYGENLDSNLRMHRSVLSPAFAVLRYRTHLTHAVRVDSNRIARSPDLSRVPCICLVLADCARQNIANGLTTSFAYSSRHLSFSWPPQNRAPRSISDGESYFLSSAIHLTSIDASMVWFRIYVGHTKFTTGHRGFGASLSIKRSPLTLHSYFPLRRGSSVAMHWACLLSSSTTATSSPGARSFVG